MDVAETPTPKHRQSAADVIDQALIEYAQKYGYTNPAPRR